jgi:hypothetical protein
MSASELYIIICLISNPATIMTYFYQGQKINSFLTKTKRAIRRIEF